VSRASAVTGLVLVGLGLAIFVWKVVFLGLPMAPTTSEGLWRVELEIDVRGENRRGSIRTPLPTSGPGQVIFDEHSSADQLLFTIRTEGEQRTGIWSGRIAGMHQITHGFRAELAEWRAELPSGPAAAPPELVENAWGGASAELPADAPEILAILETLRLPGPQDPTGRARMIFNFVSDEIAEVATGSDHALLNLATREGRAQGRTRLLVTLLRAAGIPARPVLGLRLKSGNALREEVWAEAYLGETWAPMSPSEGFFGRHPADLLALHKGSLQLIEATGADAVGYHYRALKEQLRPEEVAALMVPANPALTAVSLYRLPLGTQAVLRALLLLPLGALVIAAFRNLVGFPVFGTFLPVLLAFTLRSTSLGLGLTMVGAVIVLGILGRLVLERLRLLLVPRLSILLCVVVLSVIALALLGRELDARDLTGGVLFPMVILTMLIERFSVTLQEEGIRPALERAGYTTLVIVLLSPLFRSAHAEHLMFSFPELVVSITGVLVWIGGYTGYRVTDLIRFRLFARALEGAR
jgi:hypothetical protein